MNQSDLDDLDLLVSQNLESSYDELTRRHKQESKKLLAIATKWKKQASKSDKKTVNKAINDLQVKLSTKQKQEVEIFKSNDLNANEGEKTNVDDGQDDELTPEQLIQLTQDINLNLQAEQPQISSTESGNDTTASTATGGGGGGKKRNRQKERLARRQAQVDQLRLEAQEETKDLVDYRALETQKINGILHTKNLMVHDIIPDGNCLFSSIKDQLMIRHNREIDIQQLREMAGSYIEEHPDDFIPFLVEKSDDQQDLNLPDYCHQLVTTTIWGSDLEIMAYLKIFECPIEIVTMDTANLVFNESAHNPKLYLAFYRHAYGLGEHYNSLRDQDGR